MVNRQDEEAFAPSIFVFPFGPLNRLRGLCDKQLRRGEMKFVVRGRMKSRERRNCLI